MPSQTYSVFKPGDALTVKMFKGSPPAGAINAYLAADVLRYLTD
jgi:hypothetical protein